MQECTETTLSQSNLLHHMYFDKIIYVWRQMENVQGEICYDNDRRENAKLASKCRVNRRRSSWPPNSDDCLSANTADN